MPVSDIAAAIGLIRNWMEHRDISDKVESDPAPENLLFQFTGKNKDGTPFAIIQPKKWKTSIFVLAQLDISKPRLEKMEAMRPRDRDAFLSDLQRNIAFAPAHYAFDPGYEKTGILRGIQFSKEICYDGLAEDKLSSAMRDVSRCALFVVWEFQREFGRPEKE